MKHLFLPAQGTYMGITHVAVRVEALDRAGRRYEGEFLVDTGTIDCLASASALKAAGISAEGSDVYELADGRIVEYPYGFARVAFMGLETVSKIIFGPEAVEPILGVVALESAGIGVDPVSRTLKRAVAKPLKRSFRIHSSRHFPGLIHRVLSTA